MWCVFSSTTEVFGVISLDVTVHYMYSVLLDNIAECTAENHEYLHENMTSHPRKINVSHYRVVLCCRCFMMTDSGYIITHRKWTVDGFQQLPIIDAAHIVEFVSSILYVLMIRPPSL